MRIRIDPPAEHLGQSGAVERPYPSWHEMAERLRRERLARPEIPADAPHAREWHNLVADMIVKR